MAAGEGKFRRHYRQAPRQQDTWFLRRAVAIPAPLNFVLHREQRSFSKALPRTSKGSEYPPLALTERRKWDMHVNLVGSSCALLRPGPLPPVRRLPGRILVRSRQTFNVQI